MPVGMRLPAPLLNVSLNVCLLKHKTAVKLHLSHTDDFQSQTFYAFFACTDRVNACIMYISFSFFMGQIHGIF